MTDSAKQSVSKQEKKSGLRRRFAPRNDVTDLGCRAAPQLVVILRKSGGSSTPRPFDSSLAPRNIGSPAGACHRAARRADPAAGDDGRMHGWQTSAVSRRDAPESCIYLSPP